ncbi:hypothetical protein GOP47_0013267 [Adiantum capillus-veneris]|uniref:Nucleoporin Nup133/Nup155-like N-terminal domain-containing protein n=1 Tax=Adiantum capillus-veneris TaxID=13818 RepID=A0A9D4UND9_ADICA|nr:hypothetical protein GOP47_0013267 [Adiantum capillus-veneris]
MFSPAGARSRGKGRDGTPAAAGRGRTPIKQGHARLLSSGEEASPSSPSTPLHMQLPQSSHWLASPGTRSPLLRSSTSVRSSPAIRSLEKSKADSSQPVFVSDLPQQLRTVLLQEGPDGNTVDHSQVCGGMDQITGLSWMIQGTHLFVWRHVSHQSSESFRIFPIPHELCTASGDRIDPKHGNSWAVCIVGLQNENKKSSIKFHENYINASVVMCNRKSLAVVYWTDIFSEAGSIPVLGLSTEDTMDLTTLSGRRGDKAKHVSSMVACSYMKTDIQGCVAIACQSTGELWRFDCTRHGIAQKKVCREVDDGPSRGELGESFYIINSAAARSVAWRSEEGASKEGLRQLLLLTANGIECWDVELATGYQIHLLWTFDVLADLDSGRVLVGQKKVWLLDFQEDTAHRRLKLLLASFSRDRVNGSSYTQYFTVSYSCLSNSVQREGGVQIILPKARIEEENFLLSLHLRVGGKPEGSVMILASDGTATVAHGQGGAIKLYQFDLAWDAGKVIDACVLASSEENEEGSWLVLTERAGVWAIPGKAVLLCGVEPPERSLSRKGSQNEGPGKEDRWRTALDTSRKTSLGRDEPGLRKENPEYQEQSLQDVEAEALVGHLFTEYLRTGQTDGVLEKLQQAGAFEKEGATNVFVLASKAIVDALPKHWTSTMVANTAVLAAVSSQLAEKQRKHQQLLHFLSASKCHEELHHRQRTILHLIMEHGEKLSAVIWLRELHNSSAQARLQGSPDSVRSSKTQVAELGGAVWELGLLAGEKARRNNVMLLDRDKAEIFYSRVSDLEDLFSCIHLHSDMIINKEQTTQVQVDKTCEISYACSKALQTAIRYRDSQHTWYPSPEGLTPWYCKPVVRLGLWKLATLILELKEEASVLLPSLVATLMSHLEELADVLLEAYAGAITAMVEREEEYRGLQMEYWSRRDLLLTAMHHHARALLEIATNDVHDENGEQKRLSALRGLYSPLVSLARRHAGYQTLWDICSELKDMDSLRNLMHESMGLREGRFSNFVFEQCYKSKQFSKLLRLGEEFKDDLALFLQNHKDLLWLHELYMQHFTLTSSTLHWLAFSKEPAVSAMVESIQGELRPSCKVGKLKIADRKRLLNLAKLSALAGGEMLTSEKVMEINADIEMLEVQAEAYHLNISEEDDVLTPRQLVEMCLRSDNPDLILRAFHVFAWGGDIFRRSNKSLLEAAWLKAADQDDWILMREVSERDGWSDEQHVEALQNTALYQAAKCCYSGAYLQKGGSFEDVLPLLQEEMGGIDTEVESVETILMQHRDFPEAGQAMLVAVQMGKCIEVYKEVGEEMEL